MSGVRQYERPTPVIDCRVAAATVPGAGVDRFAETLPVVDELPPACSPEWCVDLGGALVTKSTFALWTAIETGEVGGNMLVWREGMECWTPVNRVGELAYAIEPARPTVPEENPAARIEARLEAPPEPPEPAEATTNPEVRPRPPVAEPRRIASRRPVFPARSGGGKWVALGSAIAVCAMATAALTNLLADPPAPESRGRAAAPVIPGVERAALSPDAPEPPAAEPVPAASPPAKARHEDRGQHRRRAGGRN